MSRRFARLCLSLCLAIYIFQVHILALSFVKEPSDTSVNEGDSVTLKCSVDDSAATVKWFKDGTAIKEDFVRVYARGDNSLLIRQAKKSDAGSYYCEARNKNGDKRKSKSANLTVHYICEDNFKITRPGLVFRGENVTLTCDCKGVPTPAYKWIKIGNLKGLSTDKKLVLTNAQVSDNGEYQCSAVGAQKSRSSQRDKLKVIDGAPPKIVQPPKKQIIFVLKSTEMIHCIATGDPKPKVDWYFKGNQGPIVNGSDRHVFPNGTLLLKNLQRRSAGKYKCSASNKYETSKAYTCELVQAKTGTIPEIADKIVPVGGTLSLVCKPPSDAVPAVDKVEWRLGNGNPLPSDGRIKVAGNTLEIQNTIKSDSGVYRCVAKNIAGETARDVNVTIAIYPKVVQNPQNQTVIEGKKVKFECKFSGDPKPVITWEKDGKDLPEQPERYTIKRSLLTIPSPVGDDVGLYRCSAKLGQVTERTQFAELKVREKVAIETSVGPKFDVGQMAKLHCRLAKGEKPVDIKWAKQGMPEGLLPHMKADGTVLYIKNATRSDSGNYTCTMNNSFSKTSRVIVLKIYRYTVFVAKPKNATVPLNGRALFNCSTNGSPKPHIIWYKEGDLNWKKIHQSDRIKILKNDSLLIQNVKKEDELSYKCVGGNAGNIVEAVALLKIRTNEDSDTEDGSDNMGKTVGIAVGCAGAYIILVVGLMIYCKGRRARQAKKKLVVNGEDVPLNAVDGGDKVEIVKAPDAKFEFPRQNLETIRTLGSGSYGNVFLAKASEIVEGESTSIVVVQSLTSKDEEVKKEFMKIMEMLSLKHENIAKLLGVCRENEPMYLISEYPDQGDLKTVMRDSSSPLSPTQKVNLCAAVASGMNYLTNHGHVHKDLAARNCLVNKSFDVKISFLSLNQGTYPKEYYQHDDKLIPLRWMAPEALKGQFSDMSDAWSFGVLMWEVYTDGLLPYEERSDEEVLKCVPYDLRLTKPEACPGKIFKMMEQCWEEESDERPTFGQLCEDFSEIPRESDF